MGLEVAFKRLEKGASGMEGSTLWRGGVFDVEGLEAVEVDGCAANRGMVRMPLDLLAGLGILSFTASLGARIFFLANAAALALSMLWTLGKCWPIFCTGPEAQSTTGHQK